MSLLGSMLGETIRRDAGEAAFNAVERLRELAWNRRQGNDAAETEMVELISSLDQKTLRVAVRAFTVFLDLSNIAEDRQRISVLKQRAAKRRPNPPAESAADAVDILSGESVAKNELQTVLDRLNVELVFTAHPTDAKRRSIRNKFRQLRQQLEQRDAKLLDPIDNDVQDLDATIETEIVKIWQTNFIRPWRPSVMQEVRRGMSIKPVLWDVAPEVVADIRRQLSQRYGNDVTLRGDCLSFGSWIGGDRDGHPGVTAAITAETLGWLREAAIEMHISACNELFGSLSFSVRGMKFPENIEDEITSAAKANPTLAKLLEGLPPGETCRRWLAVIGQRLHQSSLARLDAVEESNPLAYATPAELRTDVVILRDAVAAGPSGKLISAEVDHWIDRIDMFGFHLAKLDIRQDARVYAPVLIELRSKITSPTAAAGESFADDESRLAWLCETIDQDIKIDESDLSPPAADTLALFRLLRRVDAGSGGRAVGSHVISMTASAADVMTVLWFWRQSGKNEQSVLGSDAGLAISPLLETIEDLSNGPDILKLMFETPVYREHLRRQGDRQVVMLGYSDSTKDGGYLSACWSLHHSQQELAAAAEPYQIDLTFFHGRGGSLGRGGGPAARGIRSLPAGAFDGTMRLTEQGEVLADRYDDPTIARRHLDQVMGAVIRRAGLPPADDNPKWRNCTEEMATTSFRKYRELIESDGFVSFFRRVTPINEIEQLPIGSRPARRGGGGKLSDLRAIPWVFSWTQSRCMLPAWYGLGTGLAVAMEKEGGVEMLRQMYKEWPFFTAAIDNAELALAKSDMAIAGHYGRLAEDDDSHNKIAHLIETEFALSLKNLLAIIEQDELLGGTPWLRESIRVRNRYIDPLNLIQVETLRRSQTAPDNEDESTIAERRHLARLTINGIAAGMRTSG